MSRGWVFTDLGGVAGGGETVREAIRASFFRCAASSSQHFKAFAAFRP